MTLWTEKHSEGIQKVYDGLEAALKPAKDAEGARAILAGMGWPYGLAQAPETAPDRVRRSLANLALQEHIRVIMEHSMK